MEGWRLGYRPALDGLRGIAIALVVLNHALVPGFDGAGAAGVTAFFVLSGFLITALLLEEQDSGRIGLLAFYRRRALRLLPALVVVLAAASLWYLVTARPGAIAAHVLPPLFYVANFARAAGNTLYHLGHTWSLSVEEQFYLVWPLLLIVIPRRWVVPVLIPSIPTSIGLRLLADPEMAIYGPHTNAYALLAGCLIAFLLRRGFRFPGAWMIGGFVILTAAFVAPQLGLLDPRLRSPVAAIGAVLIVASVASQEPTSRGPLTIRPLVALGAISYGLYLWHYFLISAGGFIGISALITAALSIPVAIASHRYVERPFIRMKRSHSPMVGPADPPKQRGHGERLATQKP